MMMNILTKDMMKMEVSEKDTQNNIDIIRFIPLKKKQLAANCFPLKDFPNLLMLRFSQF